ncbi:DUF6090 family protein [Balneola sp. MJW-20]|uniref:DUF6090 family protein n=1 Tax=Gracilimonas aurantiaca TaxID=3234185 RepID=UPI003464FB79
MISIFRTIRQKLIDSGSVSRYLFYAIGEILLVVVGILIALQVNNWNEERLQRQEEIKVLLNVRSDLLDGIEEMGFLNDLRTKMVGVIDLLVSEREQIINNYRPEKIDSLLSALTNTPTYNNQSGSLEVLLNTGRINLVRDDTLRTLLISWPGSVEDMIEGELDQEELDRDHYRPVLRSYISINNVYKNYSLAGRIQESDEIYNRPTGVKSDHTGLLSDPLFENILVNRELLLRIAIIETEELIDTANEMIRRIDQNVSN